MNLRFGKNSIRFRVDFSEALSILENGLVTESFPFGAEDLTVRVQTIAQEKVGFAPIRENHIEISVPHSGLENLLASADQIGKRKSSLEMKDEALIGGRSIEVRFEIDYFSKAKTLK